MTTFGAAVQAALEARKAAMAEGPRTVADLARAIECDPGNLHHFLRGTKPLPAATEQAIRAALPELQEGDQPPREILPVVNSRDEKGRRLRW